MNCGNDPRTAFCPECKETVRVKRRSIYGARGDFCDKCGDLLDDRDMTPDAKLPLCPWCLTDKCVHASNSNQKAFCCRRCGREFEAEDDDGVVGYGRPEKYAERAERRQQRKVARR